jgi:hypothetical protein
MDGVYRIYAITDGAQRRLMGRLAVTDGYLHQLEDHFGTLGQLFPDGPVSNQALHRLDVMRHHPYYQVVQEDHINEGHHPADVPDLEIGPTEPEGTFTLAGEGMATPQIVEVWGEAIVMNGRRLSESDVHQIMSKVREGSLHLTPVDAKDHQL